MKLMNDETQTTQNPILAPEAEPISNIRDEDQFQDAIIAAKEKSEKLDNHQRFV